MGAAHWKGFIVKTPRFTSSCPSLPGPRVQNICVSLKTQRLKQLLLWQNESRSGSWEAEGKTKNKKHRAEAKMKYYGKRKDEYWQYTALGIAIKESKTFLFTMYFPLNVGAHEKTCGREEGPAVHFDFIRHISGTIWGLEWEKKKKKWWYGNDKLSNARCIHLVPPVFSL